MAAGLGYKEFTTGDVLTAADANGYLASQVVMVFADAAARTAAITTPEEGMISFLKDTNATEYYSGAAWVAVGGASGGMTQLATGSLSGSSVSLTSISGAYNSLYLVIRNFLPTTANTNLLATFNSDTNTRYVSEIFTPAAAVAFGSTSFRISQGTSSATANGIFTCEIPDYASTATWKFINIDGFSNNNSNTAQINTTFWKAAYNQTTAITSIQLFPQAGTFTGTYVLFGVK
jgi:hypothetical protein